MGAGGIIAEVGAWLKGVCDDDCCCCCSGGGCGCGCCTTAPTDGVMPSEAASRLRSAAVEARMRESKSRLIKSWPANYEIINDKNHRTENL